MNNNDEKRVKITADELEVMYDPFVSFMIKVYITVSLFVVTFALLTEQYALMGGVVCFMLMVTSSVRY